MSTEVCGGVSGVGYSVAGGEEMKAQTEAAKPFDALITAAKSMKVNRWDRSSFNAYMKVYMRARRKKK